MLPRTPDGDHTRPTSLRCAIAVLNETAQGGFKRVWSQGENLHGTGPPTSARHVELDHDLIHTGVDGLGEDTDVRSQQICMQRDARKTALLATEAQGGAKPGPAFCHTQVGNLQLCDPESARLSNQAAEKTPIHRRFAKAIVGVATQRTRSRHVDTQAVWQGRRFMQPKCRQSGALGADPPRHPRIAGVMGTQLAAQGRSAISHMLCTSPGILRADGIKGGGTIPTVREFQGFTQTDRQDFSAFLGPDETVELADKQKFFGGLHGEALPCAVTTIEKQALDEDIEFPRSPKGRQTLDQMRKRL